MAVRVVTDSTAYLPAGQIAEFGIDVVSLYVTFAEGDSIAEVSIAPAEFYARLASTRDLPHSSQPPAGEIDAAFRRALDAGDDVVGVFISSDMSGTFTGAGAVRDALLAERPDAVIELVDSRANCMQLGFVTLEAARAARNGRSAAECAEAARAAIPRTRFLFTVGTLEYLRRGGRIGAASALLGGILELRPILTVADGVTTTVRKVRTTRRAIEGIVALCEADLRRYGLEELVVHHIDAEDEARVIAAAFEHDLGREVPLVPLGAVIGTHVGPGAAGVVYRTRDELGRAGE